MSRTGGCVISRWDVVRMGERVEKLFHRCFHNFIASICFSPDGNQVSTTLDNTIAILDVSAWRIIRYIRDSRFFVFIKSMLSVFHQMEGVSSRVGVTVQFGYGMRGRAEPP